MTACHIKAVGNSIWKINTFVTASTVLQNKDYQRMMVDPMFMIIWNERSFLTAVTLTAVAQTAVTPIAVILLAYTLIYLN